MTQTEKDIKAKINQMITELIATDNVRKMKSEVYGRLEGIDITDEQNLKNQCHFAHLMNLFNLISSLEHKSIQHVKAGMRDYLENNNPLWMDIVKRIAA